MSYGEQLIRVQAEQELGHVDKGIRIEPVEVQGMLLDYSENKELLLKAWIALSKYKEKAREILLLYGSEPEFKEILKDYGESIIPVILYFRENDVWSVKATDATGEVLQWVTDKLGTPGSPVTGNERTNSNPAAQKKPRALGPNERGWYAVNFIRQEGHDLLGQFVLNKDRKVTRNQVDRILKAITAFFASGLRALETKYDLGDVTKADVFWAGLDVAVVAAPLALLKTGKPVARSGKELSLTTRTRVFAPRLLSKGKIFQKLGQYGAAAATLYIIVTHPSLINNVFAEAARLMNLSPWLVQFAGWSLIIAVALYSFLWLSKVLARFIILGLSWLEQPRRRKPIPKMARTDPYLGAI